MQLAIASSYIHLQELPADANLSTLDLTSDWRIFGGSDVIVFCFENKEQGDPEQSIGSLFPWLISLKRIHVFERGMKNGQIFGSLLEAKRSPNCFLSARKAQDGFVQQETNKSKLLLNMGIFNITNKLMDLLNLNIWFGFSVADKYCFTIKLFGLTYLFRNQQSLPPHTMGCGSSAVAPVAPVTPVEPVVAEGSHCG